jgi:hypothetical protein
MDGISHFSSGSSTSPAGPVRGATPPAPQTTPTEAEIPATPPPEVLEALDLAQHVVDELNRSGMTLGFTLVSESRVRCIRVEVRSSAGELIREISPSRLASILAGDSAGLVLHTRG